MDIRLSGTADMEAEIRLARSPRTARAGDFASRLQTMQAMIGARRFAVLRVAGQGLPSARRLAVFLHNWGAEDAGSAGALLDAYGAAMLSHLEASMLPLVWEGASEGQCVEAGSEPFVARLPARLLSFSGVAFPVRLGTHGNGYVVFTGSFLGLSSDVAIDMHLKSCQLLTDILAGEEKRLAPAEALSERELACLQMAGDGCISDVIAEKMGLSVHTVNAYLGTATTKLDAVNRIQAIAKAIRFGYIV